MQQSALVEQETNELDSTISTHIRGSNANTVGLPSTYVLNFRHLMFGITTTVSVVAKPKS